MLTKQAQFIAIIDNEPLKKADVIVLLTGDGLFRTEKVIQLYKQRWAPIIVISGGVNNRSYGSLPAGELGKKLIKVGIPKSIIILDGESQNTRQQAVNIIKLASRKNWKRLILVASNYHQYRAYATFLKAMLDANQMIDIINAPANLSWFRKEPWGRRIDLLESEFKKIDRYTKDGHIASYDELLNNQRWKEQNSYDQGK